MIPIMKKTSHFLLYLSLAMLASCTKNNDSIKEQLEKALPAIEVTSVGLLLQTGPFLPADVLQVTFGGALTKADPGTLDYAWYDAPATGAPVRVDSVHFDNWTTAASAATANNSVATTFTPATYPNTNVFSGNMIIKLTKLAATKSYTLRIYARTSDNKMATVAVTKFITMK